MDESTLEHIQDLIDEFRHEENFVCEQVVADLVQIGTSAVPLLIQALKDNDPNVRYYSALALISVGDERAIKPLCEMLAVEEDRENLYVVAASLPKLKGLEASYFLDSLSDSKWTHRFSSAIVLGYMNEQAAVAPLIKLLEDKDAQVRWAAVDALGRLRNSQATEPLILLLDNPDGNFRFHVVNSLGRIGDERSIPYLTTLKEIDPDPYVRKIADEGIKVIRNEIPPMKRSGYWQ